MPQGFRNLAIHCNKKKDLWKETLDLSWWNDYKKSNFDIAKVGGFRCQLVNNADKIDAFCQRR